MIARYTYSWEGNFCDSAQKEVNHSNNWCGNLRVAPIRRRSLHEWNPALRTPASYGYPDNVDTMACPFGPILTGFHCTLLPWFSTRVRAPLLQSAIRIHTIKITLAHWFVKLTVRHCLLGVLKK